MSESQVSILFLTINYGFPQLYASHEGTFEEEACRVRVTK